MKKVGLANQTVSVVSRAGPQLHTADRVALEHTSSKSPGPQLWNTWLAPNGQYEESEFEFEKRLLFLLYFEERCAPREMRTPRWVGAPRCAVQEGRLFEKEMA